MRDHYNDEELEAARILDLVRLGDDLIPWTAITWALWVLGDAVGN
jgi:hypothetical protein